MATFANQHDADLAVIDALRGAGSNMSKPHALEHHFVSKNKANLEALRDQAAANGLHVSEILSTGRLLKTYFFDVVIDTIPTIENVSPATTAMHQWAAQFSCSYDGWGCSVVE